MHTATAFVLSAWILILPLGTVMLQAAFKAHRDIDHGLKRDARVPILWAIGYLILTLCFVTTMFGIRYLIKPILIPAVVGSVASLLSLWLLLRARHRIQHE